MAYNNCLWPSGRTNPLKQMGRLKLDIVTALQAQITALTKQIGNLTHKPNSAPTKLSGEFCNLLGYSNNDFGICDTCMIGDGYME